MERSDGSLPRLTAALVDRYTIERELGAGGMATVYLAQDVRHNRKVALKVLRPELAAILGGERFLKEIQLTANLQHPHILPLHDSGEAEGIVYYVMPYVQGESLRDRLVKEKQLPVDDAVRIATEVAAALDYAHRHNVVHRDIKPENILLHEGQALVADFGIALAVSSAGGGTRMTETGMSLGTPHYMSPEQAMGEREITAKSDVYALACVLYEMLTGEPPFTGPTAQAIVARVMTEQPRSLTLQRKSIPPHVEAAVERALEKLPADRFASAAQFAEALEKGVLPGGWPTAVVTGAAAGRAVSPARRRLFAVAPWALAVLALGALAARAMFAPRPPRPVLSRFVAPLPANAAYMDPGGHTVAVSPDGATIIYTGFDSLGRAQLFLRTADRLEPTQLPGTVGAGNPAFSPDGQWFAFVTGGRIYREPVSGGAPALVCDCRAAGLSWGSRDQIAFMTGALILLVPSAGGQPTPVGTDSARGLAWPAFLPDGRHIVATLGAGSTASRLVAVDVRSGRRTDLNVVGSDARYVDAGYLVYGTPDLRLFAVPFDAGALRITGPSRPIVENVSVGSSGAVKVGVSSGGTIVYPPPIASGTDELALVSPHLPVRVLSTPAREFIGPRFSPDGKRIALIVIRSNGDRGDAWIYDLAARTLSRLTFDSTVQHPTWTPDGRRLLYAVTDSGSLVAADADFSGRRDVLMERTAATSPLEVALTPDGKTMVYRVFGPNLSRDIWIKRLDSGGVAEPLVATPFDERAIALAPNGRLAYVSNETGSDEVYVRTLERGGGRWQISDNGGTEPAWNRTGTVLYYRSGDSLIAAHLRTPDLAVVRREVLFSTRDYATDLFAADYDVAPDGRSFVFVRRAGRRNGGALLYILLNWFAQ